MRRSAALALTVTCVWLLGGQMVWAQPYGDKAHAELAKTLKGVKVSLVKGLVASESVGQPISGKFEVEQGKLHLSVYTMKGEQFSEVIVDHTTGKVATVEPISSGEDLVAAKTQAEAMTKAKQSLRAAVDKAAKANKGYRPVSVFPALKDGHPVADVTLTKGGAFKTISEPLD
jgi:hypothetical protein